MTTRTNSKFNQAREQLLLLCSEIVKIDTKSPSITNVSSWGGNPDRMVSSVGTKFFETGQVDVSPDDKKFMLKSFVTNDFNISFSLLSRLQLVQNSCSKMLDGWKGVSSDLNEFRYITERYATLTDILNKFSKENRELSVINKEAVFELSQICLESSGTRFDWHKLADKSFEEMKETRYEFVEERDIQDLTSKNIMSAIDRVERARLDGLRHFYSFCCEFVHPNVGDTISCSLDVRVLLAGDRADLRLRNLDSLSMPLDSQVDQRGDAKLILNSYLFAIRVLEDLKDQAPTILQLVKQSKKETKKFIHKAVKVQRPYYKSKELCPCGSGKTIKSCK